MDIRTPFFLVNFFVTLSMKLMYKGNKDESTIILADFNCAPSQKLLQDKGLYKIIWSKDADMTLTVDGYMLLLKKNQVLFCTPLNHIKIPKDHGMIAVVFNRAFYCIRDHDAEVSCNGFLFFGSSEPQIITLDEDNVKSFNATFHILREDCLLYTSPSPRDKRQSRMPSSA